MLQHNICNHFRVSGNECNYAIRKSSFFKDVHQNFSSIHLVVTGFPDHHIPHHRHTWSEIASNSSKVKWRNCICKPLQWSVFNTIKNTITRSGLLLIDLWSKSGIEFEKINRFTSGIDFCLENIFRLTNHGTCIDNCSVRTCDQISSFNKNRYTMLPWHCGPFCFGFQCVVNCSCYMLGLGNAICPDNVLMIVRRSNGAYFRCKDLFIAKVQGNFNGLGEHSFVGFFNLFSFWRTRTIFVSDFISWSVNFEKSVRHDAYFFVYVTNLLKSVI